MTASSVCVTLKMTNMTEIINIRTYKSKDYVYCGRGSIFGSPYTIGIDGNRDECINKYKTWFNFLLRDERFVKELLKLRNCKLGCFCLPYRCHCEVIKEYLDKYDENRKNKKSSSVFLDDI